MHVPTRSASSRRGRVRRELADSAAVVSGSSPASCRGTAQSCSHVAARLLKTSLRFAITSPSEKTLTTETRRHGDSLRNDYGWVLAAWPHVSFAEEYRLLDLPNLMILRVSVVNVLVKLELVGLNRRRTSWCSARPRTRRGHAYG